MSPRRRPHERGVDRPRRPVPQIFSADSLLILRHRSVKMRMLSSPLLSSPAITFTTLISFHSAFGEIVRSLFVPFAIRWERKDAQSTCVAEGYKSAGGRRSASSPLFLVPPMKINKASLQTRMNAIPLILIGCTERTRLKNSCFSVVCRVFWAVAVVNLIAPIS